MEDQLITDYQARALQPTLEEVIADLDLSSNYSYPKLRSYLVEAKVCKVREFNSARYAAYVEAALGTVPTSAAELIDAVVESYSIRPAASHRIGLTWTCPILGDQRPCDEVSLLREAHRINDTILGNRIPQSNIGRAVEYWLGVGHKPIIDFPEGQNRGGRVRGHPRQRPTTVLHSVGWNPTGTVS